MTLLRRPSLLLVVFPAFVSAFFLLRAPYFPAQFDDANYWIHSIRLAREGSFTALYWSREPKGTLFPLFGAPAYLLFSSVSAAMAVLMPAVFAVFVAGLFGTFRALRLSIAEAMVAALAIALLPGVFYSSLWFMPELPALAATAVGTWLLFSNRPLAAGLFAGIAIGLRPPEFSYLWAFLLLSNSVRDQRKTLLAAVVAASLAAAWLLPFAGAVGSWISLNLHAEGQAKSVSQAWQETWSLSARLLTWPGIGLVLYGLALPRKMFPRTLVLVGMVLFLLPVAFAVFRPNPPGGGAWSQQLRYFLGPACVLLGTALLRLRERKELFLGCAAIGLVWLVALPELFGNYSHGQSELNRLRDDCIARLAPVAGIFEPLGGGLISVAVGEANLPVALCALALAEGNAKGQYETGVRLAQPYASLATRYDGLAILPGASDQAGAVASALGARAKLLPAPGVLELFGPSLTREFCRQLGSSLILPGTTLALERKNGFFSAASCTGSVPGLYLKWKPLPLQDNFLAHFPNILLLGGTETDVFSAGELGRSQLRDRLKQVVPRRTTFTLHAHGWSEVATLLTFP